MRSASYCPIPTMMYFLQNAGVAVVDEASSGAARPYRGLSFATSTEKVNPGCESIAKAVEDLE